MAEINKTSDPRQAWVTLALVVFVAGFFGLIILPEIKPNQSKLVGIDAPDFAVELIHGGNPGDRVRLSNLRGKAVVLDFWASWCVPCQQQATILNGLAKESQNEVVVLGVNTDDQRNDALDFLRSRELDYSSGIDVGGAVSRGYNVTQLPTLVVVGRSGKITAVKVGLVGRSELDQLIKDALAG